ncbi:hypothetical protein PP175_15190 [Aneurinibacillus sp. Ricciae_BoGa-3]|uniref:hypothetical protein n=1 Tax=Aneurinibacillus sp. Ricciae_BoGa-3 TaxID=3022697 RepID=UPI0023411F90|nr:hypothetical protein [Aneurinibacillus sp. Ricciae_BoGa-3]WCK52768.1 hypothetical protein PP175_15190 [Aneurinibacillus sp. Ricciae_BoGa-3]
MNITTMAKKHIIYKRDNWNMMTAEADGARVIIREISSEWGEDTYIFNSRHEMMNWAGQHFAAQDYIGRDEEYNQIMETFRSI